MAGWSSDIRFPDWAKLLEPLCNDHEVYRCFKADRVSSELLGDVRLAARSRVNSGHVTALVRADRRSFRHYDNDSDARQRGTFVSVSLRAVWGPFILYAVVQKGSPLLRALLMSCSRYAWVMLTLRENGVRSSSAFILMYYVVRSVLNYVLISDVMCTHTLKRS